MTPYLIYIAVHLLILLSSISMSAISVAFPDITSSFNTSLVTAGWVLSIYQLVATGAMVLIGKVSDVFGRKRTFLLCTGFFVTGSLFAALAPNIYLLILARLIQSVGAGGFIPSVTGIIIELFPRGRQKAIGISMSIYNIGGIIGPSIGGWLLTSFGWQSIFWFNVPLGILAVIPVMWLLKSGPVQTSSIDFAGAGYFTAAIFSLMFGLSQMGHSSSSSGWLLVGLLFLAFVIFLVVFIRHEIKAPEPIVELGLLRKKPFAASNYYNFIIGACIFGFGSFIPLYAVTVYGMTTIQSSLILGARSAGMIVTAMAGSFFLIRWGYRWPMIIGSIVISISLLFMGVEPVNVSILGFELSNLTVLILLGLILGMGVGISSPASSNACLDLLPERAATITGVRGMFRQSGGAISIAMITLLLQSIGDMSLGFNVVFISTGVITLFTIPFVFAMPERAETGMVSEKLRT